MRDIAEGLASWRAAGVRFALATVVRTWSSAPRQPGSAMAVSADGEVLGSVSGGCVEGAVYDLAAEVLAAGRARTQVYGISDDDAFEVGLTCGGTIELLVVPVEPAQGAALDEVIAAVRAGRPVAMASVVSGTREAGRQLVVWPEVVRAVEEAGADLGDSGGLGDGLGHSDRLGAAVRRRAAGMLALGSTGTVRLGVHGEQRMQQVEVFVQSFVAPPRMLVFGAIDFAGAVARIGKFLGYHVTVCDARAVFATRKRFPEADDVVVQWPHRYLATAQTDERTVICVLTHDPKFDVPLLELALRTPARYIGAMGSRRTHADRLRRLREIGVDEAALGRLASPIGLDLGARTPEETAVSIAAEIVALSWGGSGRRLRDVDTPIHR